MSRRGDRFGVEVETDGAPVSKDCGTEALVRVWWPRGWHGPVTLHVGDEKVGATADVTTKVPVGGRRTVRK